MAQRNQAASHTGQRDVQCSRCTQRQTGDMEAVLRFKQIRSGLEVASSWSCSVCPHSLNYLLGPHSSLLLIWTFHFRGTESTRRVLPTLPLADVSFRLGGAGLDLVRFLLSSVSSTTNSLLLVEKLCFQLTLAQLLLGSTVTFQIPRSKATTWGSGSKRSKVRDKRHSYNKQRSSWSRSHCSSVTFFHQYLLSVT